MGGGGGGEGGGSVFQFLHKKSEPFLFLSFCSDLSGFCLFL